MLDATRGEPVHAGGGRRRARLDGVRRATLERELELRGIPVDGDQRLGAGEPGGRDHLQADASASDHGDAVTRLDTRRVADRAERRHDAAAEECGLPQREALGAAGLRPPP